MCSNLLVHDAASGQLTGIEPSPPITGCNKQLTFERNRDWFTTTHRRRRDLLVTCETPRDAFETPQRRFFDTHDGSPPLVQPPLDVSPLPSSRPREA